MRASVLRDEIVGERRRNLGGIPTILQLSCHFKKAINITLDGIMDSMDLSLSKPWGIMKDREDRRAAVHGVTKSRSQLND